MREYNIAYTTSKGQALDFNVHATSRSDALKFFKTHYRTNTHKLKSAKETKASKIEQRMLKKAAKAKAAEPVPVLTEAEAFAKMLAERRREWEANPVGGVAIVRYLRMLLCTPGDDKAFKRVVEQIVIRAENHTTR